jgi:hypothetical protein
MAGEKLKPLVIAKSSNPRCFKNIKVEKLPVHYRNNKKAWMTTELMSNWLRIVDKDMRKAGRKILLFLDNAPSHPMLKLSNVKLAFFPPNTTSRLQPMDQGIIQTLKLKYRKKQLQHILVKVDSNNKVGSQLLKEISVLDAIYWIDAAWKDIEAKTIVKCFEHSGFIFPSESVKSVNTDENHDSDDDDEVPLNVLKLSHDLFGCEFKDLINLDVTLRTCDDSNKTDWERTPALDILKELRDDNTDDLCDGACDDDDDDDVDCADDLKVCSAGDVHEHINNIRQYALFHGHNDLLDSIMCVDHIFTHISTTKQKQTRIDDFFKKA